MFITYFLMTFCAIALSVQSFQRELHGKSDLERRIETMFTSPSLLCAQSKYCDGFEMANIFTKAALQAKTACQKMFKNGGMSCQISRNEFINVTRETGFLYALMSSSVAHITYNACLNGEIKCCICNTRRADHHRGRNKTLYWNTCPCAIKSIVQTITKHLGLVNNVRSRALPAVSFAYRHNAIVGLEALKALMINSCQCNDSSDVCMKGNCWIIIPDYIKVAAILKRKYLNATFMDLGNMNTMISHKVPKNMMIYLQESTEDYCKTVTGILCHNEKICQQICCNGSFVVRYQYGKHFCNCKWVSPHMKCEKCDGAAKIYYCI